MRTDRLASGQVWWWPDPRSGLSSSMFLVLREPEHGLVFVQHILTDETLHHSAGFVLANYERLA